MDSFVAYLKPTDLCDFDQDPEIKLTVQQLTQHIVDKRQAFNRIYQFVRELPYVLEDWDVKASDTLQRRKGMCLGKSNLLVAMCRVLAIPARYRLFKIEAERTLWKWIAQQNSKLAAEMGEPLPEYDHAIAEVYFLDKWEAYDPSRDSAFEEGLKRLGIPLDRRLVADPGGYTQVITLASIDEWAANRQQARRFRKNRALVFSGVNEQFDRIRLAVRGYEETN